MKKKNNELPVIPKKSFWVRLHEEKYLQFMAILGIIWMLIFNYIPMYGILIAFKKNFYITTPLFSKKFFTTPWAPNGGFQHFLNFFKDEEFFNVMGNTLGISLIKLAVNFTLPIVFALLLNEVRNVRFKKAVQTSTYMPHFLSWVVLGGILTTWLGEGGLFNEILINMGVIKEGIPYLAYPKYFWAITVLSDLWKELGWSAIIYLAAISGIDQEMYEAAKVDGASARQCFTKITLPLIAKGVATLCIPFTLWRLTSFDLVYSMTSGGPGEDTALIAYRITTEAFTNLNIGYASAMAVLLFLIMMVFSLINMRITGSKKFET